MICDISNAYPSNTAVDASHNVQFHFVFYGDGCKEADFILYDATDTTAKPKKISTHLYDSRRVYYNGEEIDANSGGKTLGGDFVNGRSYIWKARLYEEVDLGAKKYPSVKRMSGELAEPCYFFGKVQMPKDALPEKQVTIEKNLKITLPVWMRLGTDSTYRILTAYDETTGICTLRHAFDNYPAAGTDYSITTVRDVVPKQGLDSNQLFIEKGITEFSDAEFTASGETVNGYCWFMEIGNNYVAITDYDSKTGIVTLDTTVLSANEPGTKYNIWTSFIESRYYAITTKETPVIKNPIAYPDGENIFFEAELSMGHLVDHYWLEVFEDGKLVETTKKIHMAKLSYYYKKAKANHEYHAVFHVVTSDKMVNQEDSAWWNGGTPSNVTNSCKLLTVADKPIGAIATSFDAKRHAMQIIPLGAEKASGELARGNVSDLSSFDIGTGLSVSSGDYLVLDGRSFEIKSYDSLSGELVIKLPAMKHYPAGTSFVVYAKATTTKGLRFHVLREDDYGVYLIGDFGGTPIYDYTAAAGADYVYIVQPYTLVTTSEDTKHVVAHYCQESRCSITVPSVKTWAICELLAAPYRKITNDDTRVFYPYQDNLYEYTVGEIWIAALDIDPEQAGTHNINRALYVGNHPTPVAVSGYNDYDTLSLTFTIGEVNCPGNRISFGGVKDLEAWKSFVARGNLIMLKDTDGNIWAGAITSNTYSKIHYSGRTEYKVTFEFTELKDMDEIVVSG